jgi:hypothetical protein
VLHIVAGRFQIFGREKYLLVEMRTVLRIETHRHTMHPTAVFNADALSQHAVAAIGGLRVWLKAKAREDR